MYVCMYACHSNKLCSETTGCAFTMCVCECVHGRGSGGALVRSEFTVLMACGKKLHFILSVRAA